MITETHTNTNLFDLDVEARAQGCNCFGKMGAGIAKEFAIRYPAMLIAYRKYCSIMNNSETLCGGFWLWQEDKPFVFNLFTQHQPGKHARLEHVEGSLKYMIEIAEVMRLQSIAIPQIGCGIGGLVWNDVEDIILQINKNSSWQGTLHVAIL